MSFGPLIHAGDLIIPGLLIVICSVWLGMLLVDGPTRGKR